MDELQIRLSYLIPVVSIFVSHYLGIRAVSKQTKGVRQQLRYETAYVPFIQSMYRGYMFDLQNIPADSKGRGYFLDLLSNNMQYYGPQVLNAYPRFYQAFLEVLKYDSDNPAYAFALNNYHREFQNVANALLREASILEHELELPGLATVFLQIRPGAAKNNR